MTHAPETRALALHLLGKSVPRSEVAARLKVSQAAVVRWDRAAAKKAPAACAVCLGEHAAQGSLGLCQRCSASYATLEDRTPRAIIEWAASRALSVGTPKGGGR